MHPGVVVGGCYVAARVLLVWQQVAKWHPDTASYRAGVSLTGAKSRPWVVPLVHTLFESRWQVMIVQATISGLAFFVLACAIAATMRDQRVRVAVLAGVLALGLSERVVAWDRVMLSESLAISMTALLIAALVHLDRVSAALVTAVFALWIFTRDGHLYLGGLVVVALLAARRYRVGFACLLVLVWGCAAAQNNRVIEGYNVTANISYRIADNPDRLGWFEDHGMPAGPALELDPGTRHETFNHDPAMWDWAQNQGPLTYVRFLVTHPAFTIRTVIDEKDELFDHDTVAAPVDAIPVAMPDFTWPLNAGWYTTGLVALAAAAVALSWQRLDSRKWLPLLLAASTIPHAFLAVHATPIEPDRHGVVLAFVLTVSCWWLIALAADTALRPRVGVLDDDDA